MADEEKLDPNRMHAVVGAANPLDRKTAQLLAEFLRKLNEKTGRVPIATMFAVNWHGEELSTRLVTAPRDDAGATEVAKLALEVKNFIEMLGIQGAESEEAQALFGIMKRVQSARTHLNDLRKELKHSALDDLDRMLMELLPLQLRDVEVLS